MSALAESPEVAEFREQLYIARSEGFSAATRADLRKTVRIVKDDQGKLIGLTALFFLQSFENTLMMPGRSSFLIRHNVEWNNVVAHSGFSKAVDEAKGMQTILATDDLMHPSQLKYLKHLLSTYGIGWSVHFRLTYKTLNGQVQTSIVGLSRQQKKELYGQL